MSVRWLAIVLLVLLSLGCGRRHASTSIAGTYFLPLELNYQDGRRRTWMFSQGFISEEVFDPAQMAFIITTIWAYAPVGDRCIGHADGRRYAFVSLDRGAFLGVSLLDDADATGGMVKLRRKRR